MKLYQFAILAALDSSTVASLEQGQCCQQGDTCNPFWKFDWNKGQCCPIFSFGAPATDEQTAITGQKMFCDSICVDSGIWISGLQTSYSWNTYEYHCIFAGASSLATSLAATASVMYMLQ